jgi:hypothetical protein
VHPILASLLLDLEDLSDEEALELTYEEYVRLYMDHKTPAGLIGERRTHDDEPVIFYEDRFQHAFFTASDRVARPYGKDRFDTARASRVRWIGEIIRGNIPGTTCWYLCDPPASMVKRLYIVWDEYYLIWLNSRKQGGWKFSSAYVADHSYIREKTKRGKCFWRKK